MSSDSEDEDLGPSPPIRETRKRQLKSDPPQRPEEIWLANDFSRGWPLGDDVVVYKTSSGAIKLAVVAKSYCGGRSPDSALSGRYCKVDLIPSFQLSTKISETVLVIDRYFGIGEIVRKFSNGYEGPRAREMWSKSTEMGVVLSCKTVADVARCSHNPSQQLVVKDMELGPKIGDNFLFEKPLVLYEQWVGRPMSLTFAVQLNYRNRLRATVRSSTDGILRKFTNLAGFYYPGEKVFIQIDHINSNDVKWHTIRPKFLSKRGRKYNPDRAVINFTVVQADLVEIDMDWISSPAETDITKKPRKILYKNDFSKLTPIETIVDPLYVATEVYKFTPSETDTVISMTDYMAELKEEFDGKFVKTVKNASDSGSCVTYTKKAREEPQVTMTEDEMGNEITSEGSSLQIPGLGMAADDASSGVADQPQTRPVRQQKLAREALGEHFYGMIQRTKRLLTVKWSDGTIEPDIPSYSLLPANPDIDQEDHVLDAIVFAKEARVDAYLMYGVIRSVDEWERTCVVRWFGRKTLAGEFEFVVEETCTLFEIMKHPHYERSPLGHWGLDTSRQSTELSEQALQFVENLDNGKQRARFINGTTKELSIDEVVPLNLDEVDYDDSSSSDGEDADGWEKSTFSLDGDPEHTDHDVTVKYERSAVEPSSSTWPAFEVTTQCPINHVFYEKSAMPTKTSMKAIVKEYKRLPNDLPTGIYVKAFEDKLDLLSVVIIGPNDTPFEGVPFLFDVHLHNDYPREPPRVAYIPFSDEQLNPNLYQEGRVCLSLLGTWDGKGNENWVPNESTLLQLFVSIQSIILVQEPFFNEAGYESRKGEAGTANNSMRYNETAAVNSLEYMCRAYLLHPDCFKTIIQGHVKEKWKKSGYGELVNRWATGVSKPPYPVHCSTGFLLAMRKWHRRIEAIINPPVENALAAADTTSNENARDKNESD